MSGKIRVIVVDDSALVRSLLSEIINRQSDMECIGTANDPLIAREMIREKNPDVITLDVEMPRMDGIDFLGRLMRLRPMPVVMISTLTERGAEVTMRALELGAVDFVAKPRVGLSSGLNELAAQIVDKIRVAAVAHVRRAPARSAAAIVHPDAGAATAPAPAPAAPRAEEPFKARMPVAAAPSVRFFAREIGIDIAQVSGSGPQGRISIADVKAYAKQLNTGRAAPSAGPAVPAGILLPDFAKWG